jgi:hypothetical protein
MRQPFGDIAIEFWRKICSHIVEARMGVAAIEKFGEMLAKRLVFVHKENLRLSGKSSV